MAGRCLDWLLAWCSPTIITSSTTLYFPDSLGSSANGYHQAFRYRNATQLLHFPYSVPRPSKNLIRNQRYSLVSFIPLTLYHQFNYFFNLFYLIVGLSQLFPQFVIGPLFTYLAPLAFVVSLSLFKELVDDYKRYRRDKELNYQLYECVGTDEDQVVHIRASEIQVGHVLKLHSGQRVPADCILLKSFNIEGCYVRTDQLDGETDWKLKKPVLITQKRTVEEVCQLKGTIDIEAPSKDIYSFVGSVRAFQKFNTTELQEGLTVENMLWTNVIMTSGPVLALVIFTGENTRAAKHKGVARPKISAFDQDINRVSKFLCGILCFAALVLTLCKPLNPLSGIYFIRFVLLLSSIIPISLRVNFDLARLVYSYVIQHSIQEYREPAKANVIVRNSTLPEELGRIDLLVTDKTGTLTQNKMALRRIMCQNRFYEAGAWRRGQASNNPVERAIDRAIDRAKKNGYVPLFAGPDAEPDDQIGNLFLAMALCHSVIPAFDIDTNRVILEGSSPDEMAMVNYLGEHPGICVTHRQNDLMTLTFGDHHRSWDILETFPFTSIRMRMGIILRDKVENRIYYLLKGAETAIIPALTTNPHWLIEDIETLSSAGLRTLVYCMKELSEHQYAEFRTAYAQAKAEFHDRDAKCWRIIDRHLDHSCVLLGVTGVEDPLARNVADTIESLMHAGIKIWMLTGDKVETALSAATAAGLRGRMDIFIKLTKDNCPDVDELGARLRKLTNPAGTSDPIVICLDNHVMNELMNNRDLAALFMIVAEKAKSVLGCRCSPSQKAQIVRFIKRYKPSYRIAAVGDGGNDVPMIQEAHCGLGISGQEGKQASLAADFALSEFKFLRPLLLYHGRLAQLRSTKMGSFIIHRGLVISVIQIFFSSVFYFTPLALFQGWLQVGYSTYYTMLPVFSFVFDQDVPLTVCYMFPELYKCQDDADRTLSDLTFSRILFVSIYQGAAIMVGSLLLFDDQLVNFVAIAFTALILLELLNVFTEAFSVHRIMVVAEILSVIVYALSLNFLPEYFDLDLVKNSTFWYKVVVITLISWLPVHCYKFIKRLIDPPQYIKLLS